MILTCKYWGSKDWSSLQEKNKDSLIKAIRSRNEILTHQEINNLLSFPEIIRKESEETAALNFFLRRPGGYYILLFILLFDVKKIPCTIEMLSHYIPDQVCSKATLSNVISEALQKRILLKEECSKDKRIKKITPSKELVDGWIRLKEIFEKDLGF
jgi:hypothetical protein